MVRISDARMSGTAYGTCVLHVAPESFVGGPLALVQTGDEIALDVPARRLDLLVSEEELAARRSVLGAPRTPRHPRLRAALRRPRHPGQRGLRLRLPPRRRRRRRTRDPLMDRPWDVVVVGARHPRPRDRPRAAAAPPGRARARAGARAGRSPPTRPATTPASSTRASTTRPGSLKAQLCTEGRGEALRVLRRARDRVRAVRQADHRPRRRPSSPALDELERRGHRERRPGPAPAVAATRSREIEPHAVGVAALHSPGDRDHRLRRRRPRHGRRDPRRWARRSRPASTVHASRPHPASTTIVADLRRARSRRRGPSPARASGPTAWP